MSAYLVSRSDIRALVTYAQAHMLTVDGAAVAPVDMGLMLWSENVASLRYRYPDAWAEYFPEADQISTYVHAPLTVPIWHLIKACDHFDYQSCETSYYPNCPAGRLVQQIRRHALRSVYGPYFVGNHRVMPEWEAAPWGLDDLDDEPPAEVVDLADGPAVQTLLRGVEPVKPAARLQLVYDARCARRGHAPLPAGGLFDETARNQQELF